MLKKWLFYKCLPAHTMIVPLYMFLKKIKKNMWLKNTTIIFSNRKLSRFKFLDNSFFINSKILSKTIQNRILFISIFKNYITGTRHYNYVSNFLFYNSSTPEKLYNSMLVAGSTEPCWTNGKTLCSVIECKVNWHF